MFPIGSSVASSGPVSNFNFTSIPQNFTHLHARVFLRATTTNSTPFDLAIIVNGSTPSSFSYHSIRGDGGGSSTSSTGISDTNFRIQTMVPSGSYIANSFGVAAIDILNYSSSSVSKTLKSINGVENNSSVTPLGFVGMSASGFYNTSPITSLTFSTFGDFAQFSRVDLYGISISTQAGT
jgi:hypothetical protein